MAGVEQDFGLSSSWRLRPSSPRLIAITANAMARLSKHMAFFACLMILGQASGRAEIGPVGIFVLVVLAVLLHRAERALHRRLPARFPSREARS